MKFLLNNILNYVFVWFWLCWALERMDFSGSGEWAPLLQLTGSRAHGLSSLAHGLSCFKECGIFQNQGSNLLPLH